jgi:flagellar biosynthesis/type III secretory pathway M-ring protein FliF/YscJ
MDFFKSQLDRIQQQLAGLSASQKMLAACLVIIIVMTVAWWGRLAGTSETATLFDEALDPAEAGRVVQLLTARGIDADVGPDNRVHVPAAQANRALADLAVSEAMPRGPSIDFDSLMKGLTPFVSQSMTDATLVNFKGTKLAEIIRRGFSDVVEAHVIIDATRKWGIEGAGIEPTATVHVRTRHAKPLPQRQVDGAAALVLGAQAGMTWKNVQVLVNGVLQRVSDPETRGAESNELWAQQDAQQKASETRIVNALKIPGVSATVSFDVQRESVRTRTDGFDKQKSFTLQTENEDKNRETIGGGVVPSGEPGTLPNATMAVVPAAAAGAGEQSSQETDSKAKFQAFASRVTEERTRLAGLGRPTGAAVLIPRSHVVNVLKFAKKDAPEPSEQQIQDWMKAEMPVLSRTVQTAAGLDSVEKVSVGLYADLIPPQVPGAATPAQAAVFSAATLTSLADTHSREIMLGGLAVMSLFMVSMMVRRGAPATVAVTGGALPALAMPVLDASEQLAGEVSEGKSMLDAMELDEDAVRAQQMVDQVAAMVEDDPDAAAGLVKRWMSRT